MRKSIRCTLSIILIIPLLLSCVAVTLNAEFSVQGTSNIIDLPLSDTTFEEGTPSSNWIKTGTANYEVVDGGHAGSNKSLYITTASNQTARIYYKFKVRKDTSYTVRFFAKGSLHNNNVLTAILTDHQISSGTVAENKIADTDKVDTTLNTTTWQEISVALPVQDENSTDSMDCYLYLHVNNKGNVKVYFDDLTVAKVDATATTDVIDLPLSDTTFEEGTPSSNWIKTGTANYTVADGGHAGSNKSLYITTTSNQAARIYYKFKARKDTAYNVRFFAKGSLHSDNVLTAILTDHQISSGTVADNKIADTDKVDTELSTTTWQGFSLYLPAQDENSTDSMDCYLYLHVNNKGNVKVYVDDLTINKIGLRENLIYAWKSLQDESKQTTDTIAYPLPTVRMAVAPSIKATYGLTDEEYELLGEYYACVDITTAENGSLFFKNKDGEDGISLLGYDKACVFVKTMDEDYNEADGALVFQINEGKDGSESSYPKPKQLSPKWNYVVKNTNVRYADYFTGAKTANNLKFMKDKGCKYVLVGVVKGYKSVSAEPLPQNYDSMDLRELVSAARSVDYKGFKSENLFAEALKDAMSVLDVSVGYSDDLIQAFNALPVDKPADLADLAFDDLVAIAEKVDTTYIESDSFIEKLQVCKNLLSDRKQKVIAGATALGLTLPDGVENLNTEAFVEAVLSLDILSAEGDKAELVKSISELYSLTETGIAIQELASVWKKIGDLPENSELLKPAKWVDKAEKLDVSNADDEVKNAFVVALANLKDLLTKGKGDVSALEELVNKAFTMSISNFSEQSGQTFKNARNQSKNTLENKDRKTQNAIDKSASDLLGAWGQLEVYNRTMWMDFLEYYTGENPEASHNSERTNVSHSAVNIVTLPNGINTALKVSNQPVGWYPVNHTGIELENLMEYQYFEFYFRAYPETFKGNAILFQLQASNGVVWYNATVPISSSKVCGDWCRIELPLKNFSRITQINGEEVESSYKLSNDSGFRAYKVRVNNSGGTENSYEISSIAAISVYNATAGVVPEIAKIVVKDRTVTETKIPSNPFTGVDRGDPWGDEERKNTPYTEDNEYELSAIDFDFDDNDADEVRIIGEGICGDDLVWELTSDGVLTVTGSGEMYDYEDETPWEKRLLRITKVSIGDGVTKIGDGAFYGCKSLEEVLIPESVTTIGAYAFYDCNALSEITLSENVTKIGDAAVGYIYDEENNSLAKVSPFNLIVVGGSEAYKYAKNYGINYSLSSGEETILDGKSTTKTVGDKLISWIIPVSIVSGVLIVIGIGVGISIFVIKRRKNKKN